MYSRYLITRVKNDSLLKVMFSLITIATLSGCGSGVATPTTAQATVSGSVTFDGKPVPVDSSIVFYSKDLAATASGKIDSLGKYSLTGSIPSVGIPVGRYTVMIRPPEAVVAPIGTADYEKMMQGKTTKLEPPKEIPAKFHALDTSGLVFELKAGPNTFDLDLAKL